MIIKIATWNIGEDESKPNCVLDMDSYNYIKKQIDCNEIDIICFQESIIDSSKMPTISAYLKESSPLKYSADFKLSPSHINIGSMMGVTICSKYLIDNTVSLLMDNPNLTYQKTNDIIYHSHDKGFVVSYFNKLPLVIMNGHCLPFQAFKKDPKDYIDIYKKTEKEFLNILDNNKNVILTGDMNYECIEELFPNYLKKTNKAISGNTRRDKQYDYIITSSNIEILDSEIIDCPFDHRLCIVTLEIGDKNVR